MRVHILGIAGTFMGSLAQLAKSLGHQVSGCDKAIYPPMSDQLAQAGIDVIESFAAKDIPENIDCFIIGNAISRGNPALEYILDKGFTYTSGPQWIGEHVLKHKWVAAISGTHGKTTTSSMVAWILEYAGMKPGFLIGGVPENFGVSARLGESDFFVIEADEYDTAFFDKRSKFLHYRPKTLAINNLEYDHADIFDDLAAIERQFHHLVRTIAQSGHIFVPDNNESIQRVLKQGLWSGCSHIGNSTGEMYYELLQPDGRKFLVKQGEESVVVKWNLEGLHNINNAMMALACAKHMGVPLNLGAQALAEFESVKRRMQLRAESQGIKLYDDFAHHPTAIATSLEGARARLSKDSQASRLIAIIEPRSNTMKMGVHQNRLVDSVQQADVVYWFAPDGLEQSLGMVSEQVNMSISDDLESMVSTIIKNTRQGDNLVVMSNGGFGGIIEKLRQGLNLQVVS